MKEETRTVLQKTAWVLFGAILLAHILNWVSEFRYGILPYQLPFKLDGSRITAISDTTLVDELTDGELIAVDSLRISTLISDARADAIINRQMNNRFEVISINSESSSGYERLDTFVHNKQSVRLMYRHPDQEARRIRTITLHRGFRQANFYAFLGVFFFIFMFMFNVYLLLRYSASSENLLIVYFMLCLAIPNDLPGTSPIPLIEALSSGMLGVLFYHFINRKLQISRPPVVLYIISIILAGCMGILSTVGDVSLSLVVYGWSIALMLAAFVRLVRQYRSTGEMALRRLMNAFRGLLIALISLVVLVTMVLLLTYLREALMGLDPSHPLMLAILMLIGLGAFSFILGVLWFLGSFTWSLLTGTVMDVKIRSTLIYTIVGTFFVVTFGLIDYALGELLQNIFGQFMGSEFIAGIPATIGLLAFFNPIRNKVEGIVDSKLNTSDLDFLEKTESFTDALGGESVIEGFEEYICENLIALLPITKIALISYNRPERDYIFNEIRGSDVVENSRVNDVHNILPQGAIYRTYGPVNEDPQEISSFSLVLPIVFDDEYKWFLAVGKKEDGTAYTKKDEVAFQRLADRIQLSLKFILAYEEILKKQYNRQLEQKNKAIRSREETIHQLQEQIDQLQEELRLVTKTEESP
jgi:hypothetical protein